MMFNLFGAARKTARLAAVFGVGMTVAACDVDLAQIGGPLANAGGGDTVDVALLLPYGSATPGDESIAQSLENAARLAAADLGGDAVNITVYRTAGSAGTAASVADQAAAAGADIIIGPLRSDTSNAAAVAVSDDGLNVLSFSNNSSIAGGNLFILGNTFDNISRRLMQYAGSQGRNRVVVVYPRTAVGQIAKSSITRAAAGTSVSIVGEGAFDFSQEGVTAAVPTIANTIKSSGATAVMLTSDSTGALPILAQLLPEQGVSPSVTKYLGLTRWDIPPQTLALPGLQGGWFALPDPSANGQFKARYQTAYGAAPHPLAALAYDGIAAVGTLASGSKGLNAGALTQNAGFAGANGVFRFRPDGTNDRALAVAQVANSQVQIIDPAPKSFRRGGS